MREDMYIDRPLIEGFPRMEALYVENKMAAPHDTGIADTLKCLRRLMRLGTGSRIAVIGCGPEPHTLAELLREGFEAVGVEPVAGSAQAARVFLGNAEGVRQGTAERLPFTEESQDVVLMESVLEHVDSPPTSLAEVYRVLKHGGVLFVRTTNRWRFSPTGKNMEFKVPFYNWFPRVVKESYVFEHLHYRPKLANYSPRPAVHWFSYPDLCSLGRNVGFAQFYHPCDLLNLPESKEAPRPWPRRVLDRLRANPWLRGLNLTQIGGDIFMVKRAQ